MPVAALDDMNAEGEARPRCAARRPLATSSAAAFSMGCTALAALIAIELEEELGHGARLAGLEGFELCEEGFELCDELVAGDVVEAPGHGLPPQRPKAGPTGTAKPARSHGTTLPTRCTR